MQGGVLRNIPNALSAYRLAMAPVLTGLALTGREKPFVFLIVVSLITNIMDGLIARAFRLQSQFGAKLDSIVDDATYVAAFTGVQARSCWLCAVSRAKNPHSPRIHPSPSSVPPAGLYSQPMTPA